LEDWSAMAFGRRALGYDLSMIFSENRFALFRIMLEGER